MKKFLVILTTVLGIGLLTGCGNTEVKANETETYVEIEQVEYEAEEATYTKLREEEFYAELDEYIEEMKLDESYNDLDEEYLNDVIKVYESIVYDPSFELCYDVEKFVTDVCAVEINYNQHTVSECRVEYEALNDLY